MHVYSFEKLEVWREARELVKWIYKITCDFPVDERFGLVQQLRRASISVVSNLAEGSSRKTPEDQARFYVITYSSLMEILNQLIVSNDLEFIPDKTLSEGRTMIEKISFKVNALRNASLKNTYPPKP